MSNNLRAWFVGGCVASLVALPAILLSAERSSDNDAGDAASVKATDMFELMASKEIDVTLIPKDEFQSRVIIRNNTNQPLNVKLPEAFAGMPILAQRGGGAGGIAGGGRAGGVGGQQQSVGGGMGGMGGGMGGMGGGMGMMNVAPEKVAQFKVPTVCLEHGKKTPNAHMAYRIRPIDAFSTKPELKALLSTFGKEKLDQRATQAAAWHLSNDLTWEQLAGKRIEHLDGSSEPWFSGEEIQAGREISQVAVAKAEEAKAEDAKAKDKAKKKPKGDSHSESSNRESNDRAAAAEPDSSAK